RPQALLHALAQPAPAGIARPAAARVDTALGGDDDLVAVVLELFAQRVAQDLLRLAEAVRLRGVEEVHPQFTGVPDGVHGGLLVEGPPLPAELPGSESNPGDFQSRSPQDRVPHVPITPQFR